MNILPTPTHAQVFSIKKDLIYSGLFHSYYSLIIFAQHVALLYLVKTLLFIFQYDEYCEVYCDYYLH
jgi:hypothetical protein